MTSCLVVGASPKDDARGGGGQVGLLPHGLVFAVGDGGRIVAVTEVIAHYLARPAKAWIGIPMSSVVGPSAWAALAGGASTIELGEKEGLAGWVASSHHAGAHLLVELEPSMGAVDARSPLWLAELRQAMADLAGCDEEARIAQLGAVWAKKLYGYDHVIVQRFDDEWNGEVIADTSREDGRGRLVGVFFPASDLPTATQGTYQRKPIRILPDLDAPPTHLLTASGQIFAAGTEECVLRGLTSENLWRIRRLGGRAVMAAAILVNGKLWGLLVMKHTTPRYVGPEARAWLERYVAALGARISLAIGIRDHLADTAVYEQVSVLADFVRQAPIEELTSQAVLTRSLDFMHADGAVYAPTDGPLVRVGVTPSEEMCAELAGWLGRSLAPREVIATHRLSARFAAAEEMEPLMCGTLGLRIGEPAGVVLWLRREQSRPMRWVAAQTAADQEEEPTDPALRHSLERSRTVIKGTSLRWHRSTIVHAPSVVAVLAEALARVAKHEAERAMHERDERIRTVLEGTGVSVWELSKRDQRILLDDQLLQALGYGAGETTLEVARLRSMIHPEDVAEIERSLPRWLEQSTFTVDLRLRRKDGEYAWLRVRGRATDRDEHGVARSLAGTVFDATERKHVEARTSAAQRMEATGHLAGGIAHDFNNLLSVVVASASALEADLASDDPRREDTHAILHAAERGAQLTKRLLAFARKQSLEMRPLSPAAMLSSLETLLSRALGEDIDLRVFVAPDVWPVRGDAAQLEQVLVNLAVNARDAMPNGGALTIEVKNEKGDAANGRADMVRIRVSDTGMGMSPEVAQRVFEPFFTTKARGRGTGLGLSMAHGIVADHGGVILVDSKEGVGTTFTVRLPRHAAELGSESLKPAVTAALHSAGTVLIVEDEPLLREALARTLRRAGHTVLEAGDAVGALEVVRAHVGPIDVLVTDVVLPGMNGRQLADAIAKTRSGIHVLFVSGYDETRVQRHGIDRVQERFLAKPFPPAVLAAEVASLMDSVPPQR